MRVVYIVLGKVNISRVTEVSNEHPPCYIIEMFAPEGFRRTTSIELLEALEIADRTAFGLPSRFPNYCKID